jgi:hypothetical protein
MTLEIREVGMSDDSLSDWLEALSGRFVSTKVKKRIFLEANAKSLVPELINSLHLNSNSVSVIKGISDLWNNYVLTKASSLIDDKKFDQILELSESFYSIKDFNIDAARRLVRLVLPHFEIEEISSSLTLYLVHTHPQDPIAAKILRRFKNSEAATFVSASRYLREKIPEDVASAKFTESFERFSFANPNFGNIDEHTLVFITEKVRGNLAPHLARLIEAECEFLVINEKIVTSYQGLQPDSEKAKVSFVEKISLEHDTAIFEQADILSEVILKQLIKTAESSKLKAFLKKFEEALLIRFRDLITPSVREEHYFKSFVESSKIKNVIIIGNKISAEALASYDHNHEKPIAFLSSQGDLEIVSRRQSLDESDLMAFIEELPSLAPFDAYNPNAAPDLEGHLLLVANLSDRQTWGNMLPLLPELAEESSLYIFPAPANMRRVSKSVSNYADSDIQKTLARPNVFLPKASKKKKILSLLTIDNIDRKLITLAMNLHKKRPRLPWLRAKHIGFGLKSTRYAVLKSAKLIERALQHASHIAAAWEPVTSTSGSVLVCPGRHLESTIITCMAKKYNIPTYELQNGTISASGRFVKPITNTIFANDEFSLDVYQKLGVSRDRIKLVGSPRIDAGLAPLRQYTATKAKSEVFGQKLTKDRKVIMYASQPLGPEISPHLFRLVASAVKQLPNYTLLLRPHPSETKTDLEAYMRELANIGLSSSRFIISARHPLELQAVDVVCTYYSTMGMEALALNKPVVCVALDDAPIPFNLCQLGAIGPCQNIADLSHQFENAAPNAFSKGKVPAFARGNSVAEILKSFSKG